MNMQKLVDMIGESARNTRKDYHLTLGGLIKTLEAADPTAHVVFDNGGAPDNPHSYRGYYSDLSFPASGTPITAADFLAICRSALNSTFEGYKGGDFCMGADTPLWTAPYGCCGPAIIAASQQGSRVVLVTKTIED